MNQMETAGCVLITVATVVLVLKHQAIRIRSCDWYALDMLVQKYYFCGEEHKKMKLDCETKITQSYVLTLSVREPSYLGLTRSISWLLMPWLLTSPGHQQPWYWLYRIYRSFYYLRKCFKYLCQINAEEWHKCKYMFMFPLKKLARKGLRDSSKNLGLQRMKSEWYSPLMYSTSPDKIIVVKM